MWLTYDNGPTCQLPFLSSPLLFFSLFLSLLLCHLLSSPIHCRRWSSTITSSSTSSTSCSYLSPLCVVAQVIVHPLPPPPPPPARVSGGDRAQADGGWMWARQGAGKFCPRRLRRGARRRESSSGTPPPRSSTPSLRRESSLPTPSLPAPHHRHGA